MPLADNQAFLLSSVAICWALLYSWRRGTRLSIGEDMLMPWWWVASAFAFYTVSTSLAMLVDPAIFAPPITDPRALKRRRIFGSSAFLLIGILMGVSAYHDFVSSPSHAIEKNWDTDLLFGCKFIILILWAIPTILVWIPIASRARKRRSIDRPDSSPD